MHDPELILTEIEKNHWVFSSQAESKESREQINQAWGFFDRQEFYDAERLSRKVLESSPYHLDALNNLAICAYYTGDVEKAIREASKAVEIGLSAIPEGFSWFNAKMSWYELNNRPFMRSYYSLGLYLQETKEFKKSEQIFRRLISINPSDNLGARQPYMKACFSLGKYEKAARFYKKVKWDNPDMGMCGALAHLASGKIDEGTQILKEVFEEYPRFVVLASQEEFFEPADYEPYHHSLGSDAHAYHHWSEFFRYWRNNPEALVTLKNIHLNLFKGVF